MYIPDPVELMNDRIERQIDLVDENNTYPCCECGERKHIDEMLPVTPDPSSPGICGECRPGEI